MTENRTAGSASDAPTRWREDGVCFLVGVVALLIAGLQPLVLGGLSDEHRLSASQIGLAATVELLALGLACGLAAALLKPVNIRAKIIAACLAHVAADLAGVWLSGYALIAARGLAGVFAGLMLWMTISMIARSARPERYSGIFFTVQTLAQLALAGLAPILIMPRFGTNGVLVCLAALSLLAAVAAAFGPRRFAALPDTGGGAIGARPLAGLLAIFLFMAFIVAVWVYLEPLAAHAGLSAKAAGEAIAFALGCQVLGAGVATVIGDRAPPIRLLLAVAALDALILLLLWAAPSAGLFVCAVAAFGFLWLFAVPFQTLLLIQIDPSRRAAMQIGAAQLLGSSAGPLVASFLVTDTNILGAILLAAGCLTASTGLIIVLALSARRPADAAAQVA